MPSANVVILVGNLTRDPVKRFTPAGMPLCEFGIAINRKVKDREDEVTYVDITAWSRTAEVIAEYCRKGDPIYIEGRLKFDSWDDKNGGGRRSKLSVVCESFQFLKSRGDGGSRQDDRPSNGGNQQNGGQRHQGSYGPEYGQQYSGREPEQDDQPVDVPF